MVQNSKKITFLIVVYNKLLSASSTLTSLLEHQPSDINIVICNNGPASVADEFQQLNATYKNLFFVEYLHNMPLAALYNNVINTHPAEYYVILDDDTIINPSYLDEVQHFTGDVLVPEIFSNQQKRYPVAGKRVVYTKVGRVSSPIISITSGLVISDYLVNEFNQEFGDVFDERLAFYGIDLSFFYRLSDYNKYNVVSQGALYHSLSKFEVESDAVKVFRKKEHILSKLVLFRWYRNQGKTAFLKCWELLIKGLLLGVKEQDYKFIKATLFAFKFGKHPRCK